MGGIKTLLQHPRESHRDNCLKPGMWNQTNFLDSLNRQVRRMVQK